MSTLYDVLGISRQSDAAQIAQAYASSVAALISDKGDAHYERDMIRAKAIREAHDILSVPSRRQAYDEKLRLKEQVTYEVVKKPGSAWTPIVLLALILVGGAVYYKIHLRQVEVERIELEATKARMEAEIAARTAAAEEAMLTRQVLQERSQAELTRQRETEQARRDGDRIHNDLQRADAQAARDKAQAERRMQMDRLQEERAAQDRVRNQNAAMQRALSIPIQRH